MNMETNKNFIPRRSRLDECKPAELAIRKAIDAVEDLGASKELTAATDCLGQALGIVSDHIDKHELISRGELLDELRTILGVVYGNETFSFYQISTAVIEQKKV